MCSSEWADNNSNKKDAESSGTGIPGRERRYASSPSTFHTTTNVVILGIAAGNQRMAVSLSGPKLPNTLTHLSRLCEPTHVPSDCFAALSNG